MSPHAPSTPAGQEHANSLESADVNDRNSDPENRASIRASSVSERTPHSPSLNPTDATQLRDDNSLDSEDDYITSDEDILTTVMSSDDQRHHFAYGSTFAEHTEYFSKSLSYALDSVKLDKSVVAQAQLSGHLNNKLQKLAEKHTELVDKISTLKKLYAYHLSTGRVTELEKDLADITNRINTLKNGLPKTLLFGRKGTVGVAEKYPIEYNQAKDKVLERVSD